MSSTNDAFIKFIECYERLPDLWDVSLPTYTDKESKRYAYGELLKSYQNYLPNATLDDMKRKINIIRTNYRKELKKVSESKSCSMNEEDVYSPRCWIYKKMSFLKKNEELSLKPLTARQFQEANQSYANASVEQDYDIPSEGQDVAASTGLFESIDCEIKKRKLSETSLQSDTTNAPSKINCEENFEDYSNTIAKLWSFKLKRLKPDQRLLAEKFISDVLFEAELGNLNRHYVKINEDKNISPSPLHNADTNIIRNIKHESDDSL